MTNSKKSYWLIIGTQTGISLFAFTILEILGGSDSVFYSLAFLILALGIYASIISYKIQNSVIKKLLWIVFTTILTITNLFVVGQFVGQIVAMLFGVWTFPPQD